MKNQCNYNKRKNTKFSNTKKCINKKIVHDFKIKTTHHNKSKESKLNVEAEKEIGRIYHELNKYIF